MNIGIITQPNSKGQIVIPAKFRKALGIFEGVNLSISLLDTGLYVQPVSVTTKTLDDNTAYLSAIKKYKGSWGRPTKKDLAEEMAREKREKEASRRNYNAW